jgi:membrane protease YdiL (CAAX protease family)
MSDERTDDLVELYRAVGLPEAQALFFRLEEAGIPARIDNEMLQGVIGEVPAGWDTAPRVLVARERLEMAEQVLREFQPAVAATSESDGDGREACLACGAPMGTADTCPACGWTYGPASDPEPPIPPSETPAQQNATAPPESGPPPDAGPPPMTGGAAWLEIAAVLAVGVVPPLLTVIGNPAPVPYWVDTVQLTGLSVCTVFVTLYLIHRSREPWERFGIVRPSGWDIPLGFGILVIGELTWLVSLRLGLPDNPSSYPFPVARSRADYAMMVIKLGANAFAEELVVRAYLITRLEVLLRSRAFAVLVSSVLFASYHLYQGVYDSLFVLFLGLAFGFAYLGVRRVWPLAIGHMLFGIHAELSH